jgi:hypothetical protein
MHLLNIRCFDRESTPSNTIKLVVPKLFEALSLLLVSEEKSTSPQLTQSL